MLPRLALHVGETANAVGCESISPQMFVERQIPLETVEHEALGLGKGVEKLLLDTCRRSAHEILDGNAGHPCQRRPDLFVIWLQMMFSDLVPVFGEI